MRSLVEIGHWLVNHCIWLSIEAFFLTQRFTVNELGSRSVKVFISQVLIFLFTNMSFSHSCILLAARFNARKKRKKWYTVSCVLAQWTCTWVPRFWTCILLLAIIWITNIYSSKFSYQGSWFLELSFFFIIFVFIINSTYSRTILPV